MVIRHTCVALLALAAGCRLHFEELTPPGDALGDDAIATVTWTFGERDTSMVKNVTTDATLTLGSSMFNFGANPALSVNSAPIDNRSLLRFDVSILSASARVVRAYLQLDIDDSADLVAGTLELRAVEESWVEGAGFGNPGPGVTWTVRDTGVPWMTPGGTFSLSTGSSVALGATPGPMVIDLPLAVAQGWIDDPATNHGVLLLSATGHWHPISKDGPVAAERPELVLEIATP